MPSDPELFPGAAPKKKNKRDYLYEAICQAVYERHWQEVKGMYKGRANRAVKELRQRGIENTPEAASDLRWRVRRWHEVFKWKEPLVNPMTLVADWDGCGPVKQTTIQPGQPSRKEQAERDAKLRREHEAAWAWWESLSTSERLAKLSHHSPGTPTGHIVLHEFDRKE